MIGRTARHHGGEAEHIGLEHGADFGVLAFLDRRQIAVAGIVHQHVDARRTSPRRLDRGRDLRRLVHVQGQGEAGFGIRGDEIGDFCRVAGGDDHPIAGFEQGFRQFAAESGRAAGDEPDRPGNVRHGALSIAVGLAFRLPNLASQCGAASKSRHKRLAETQDRVFGPESRGRGGVDASGICSAVLLLAGRTAGDPMLWRTPAAPFGQRGRAIGNRR